ncbi:DUF3099 domain-containing protein [Microbacterium resistens]|uniref:DUF3099 domain-containing protein n=1 Tax=Microbacterium resistens TaxID=156977 RepID=A0ABY3RTQ9_9MICO|nr:DUF3099 domain-containing protein [Microbacterium resistens]MBW1640982.1 DUF3099 domain-containing protein [Microbacterium resistens]UGS27344.1 DUF3099 domain-containing protein [Microbacterium resistens]
MRKSRTAPSLTSLPRAPRDEAKGRARQYIVTMSIRVACLLLMVVVTPYGWYTWLFALAAIVLPYIAVVFANAGDDSTETVIESPQLGITAAPTEPAPPASDEGRPTLRIQETGSTPADPDPGAAR